LVATLLPPRLGKGRVLAGPTPGHEESEDHHKDSADDAEVTERGGDGNAGVAHVISSCPLDVGEAADLEGEDEAFLCVLIDSEVKFRLVELILGAADAEELLIAEAVVRGEEESSPGTALAAVTLFRRRDREAKHGVLLVVPVVGLAAPEGGQPLSSGSSLLLPTREGPGRLATLLRLDDGPGGHLSAGHRQDVRVLRAERHDVHRRHRACLDSVEDELPDLGMSGGRLGDRAARTAIPLDDDDGGRLGRLDGVDGREDVVSVVGVVAHCFLSCFVGRDPFPTNILVIPQWNDYCMGQSMTSRCSVETA
jgi:hypothetical protein